MTWTPTDEMREAVARALRCTLFAVNYEDKEHIAVDAALAALAPHIAAAIEKARREEREACADAADRCARAHGSRVAGRDDKSVRLSVAVAETIAAAIRARGQDNG